MHLAFEIITLCLSTCSPHPLTDWYTYTHTHYRQIQGLICNHHQSTYGAFSVLSYILQSIFFCMQLEEFR